MLECLYNVHFHLSISGEDIRLMLWDTAGQEEFDAITKAYYRGEFFFFFFLCFFFFFFFFFFCSRISSPNLCISSHEKMGVLLSFSIRNIIYDKFDLRLYVHVTVCK